MTAWDFASGAFTQDKVLSATPTGLFFREDGLKMYHCRFADNNTLEYNLSTPFDVSTAVLAFQFGAGGNDVFFKNDGTKWFRLLAGSIQEFNTVTPWQLSGSTSGALQALPEDDFHESVFFRDDGLIMFTIGSGNSTEGSSDRVYRYDLSVAWDITTAVHVQDFHVVENLPTGIFFKNDGTRMFVLGAEDNTLSNDSTLWEYPLTVAWDISSTTIPIQTDITVHDTYPRGLHFAPNGSKAFFGGVQNDKVYEYTLGIGFTSSCSLGLTFSDDFSSYNDQAEANLAWVSSDLTRLIANQSTEELQYFNSANDAEIDKQIYHDLGETLNGNFTLRMKHDITNIVSNNQAGTVMSFGISSITGKRGAIQDALFIQYSVDTGPGSQQEIRTTFADGTAVSNQETMRTSVTAQVEYLEILRTSSTSVTFNIYSDANYTVLTDTVTRVIPATIDGLRYLKIYWARPASTNQLDGTIDDITLTVDPVGQGCFAVDAFIKRLGADTTCFLGTVFEDDFSSYINQIVADASWVPQKPTGFGFARVNTSTGVLDWQMQRDGSDNRITHDLGVGALSDTEWTLRFTYHLNAGNTLTSINGANFQVLLQDTDVGQDSINNSVSLGMQNTSLPFGRQMTTISFAGGIQLGFQQGTFNTMFYDGTAIDYHMELVRLSPTAIRARRYSDPSFTNLLEEHNIIANANIDNLRYIIASSGDNTVPGGWNGISLGYIDDIVLTSPVLGQGCFIIDAVIPPLKNFTVGAILPTRDAVGLIMDAFLTIEGNVEEFIIDGIVKGLDINKTFLIDGLPFIPPANLFQVDAFIQELDKTIDFFIDARIRQGNTETFFVDGLTKGANTETALIDAIITTILVIPFDVDAELVKLEKFTIDSVIGAVEPFQSLLFVESVIGRGL